MIPEANVWLKPVSMDEMNIHLTQSIQGMTEIRKIAMISKQIISPSSSKPVVGIIQDSLVGSYKLSNNLTILDKYQISDLIMTVPNYTGYVPDADKGENWSGKAIMSMLLPEFNYNNGKVEIVNGRIVSGILDKKSIGKGKSGNIIHIINNDFPEEAIVDFMTSIQLMTARYLLFKGMTIGLSDMVITDKTKKEIEAKLKEGQKNTSEIMNKVFNGTFVSPLGKTNEEYFEIQMKNELDGLRDDIGNIANRNVDDNINNFKAMTNSGSKGSTLNMAQVMGSVGQQSISGRRVDKMYGDRTLPHFHKYDDSPLARGFIYHSFIEGLNPVEFYFHAISGREGNIDTAIKSVTGDTVITFIENGVLKMQEIGPYIDSLLEANPHTTDHKEELEMELLNVKHLNIKIPTTDENGNISWSEMTDVTRHLPGKQLYKIKTKFGREVIVTESKSLLVWNKETRVYEQRFTPTVAVGDSLPVTLKLPSINVKRTEINGYDNYYMSYQLTRNGLIHKFDDKNQIELDILNYSFEQIGDTFLDEIVSIEEVNIDAYPKVYDVTVPSTTNFCLANGLHVVDTADSGYISRKIIRSLEDYRVCYDNTVRNSGDQVIQFMANNDGIEYTKFENQKFPSILLSKKKTEEMYLFTKDELKKILDKKLFMLLFGNKKREKETLDILNKEYAEILEDQKNLRDLVSQERNISDKISCPVHMRRIIDNCINLFEIDTNANIANGSVTLSPTLIVKKINVLCNDLKNVFGEYDSRYDDATSLIKSLIKSMLSCKRVITKYKFSEGHIDHIISEIKVKFIKSLMDPGEMLGAIAAQSFGEVSTQLTLNSVDYNEKFIFRENDKVQIMKIGEFIDNKINTIDPKHIQDHPNDTKYVDVTETNDYEVLSVDEDGKMHWKKLEGLSKHPPLNKDGEIDKLVYVKTHLGRTVTATKAKSFLVRKNDKIVPINGSDISIGDYLPVVANLPEPDNPLQELDISQYLSKKEYTFGSEMKKAFEFKQSQIKKTGNINAHWFKGFHGIKFITPYARGDSLMVAYRSGAHINGYVYPKHNVSNKKNKKKYIETRKECKGNSNDRNVKSMIPEKIELDELFGFFVGAYLAEGTYSEYQLCISNNDKNYRKKIFEFCDKCSINYRTVVQKDKICVGWTSTDVRIQSKLLCELMIKICGRGSAGKHIPDFAVIANKEFLRGLINGYFSGDGSVSKDKSCYISACSVSEDLIDGLIHILSRFNILAKKSGPFKIKKNNRGSKNILPHFNIYIRNENVKIFANEFTLAIDYKQDLLNKAKNYNYKYRHYKNEIIPGFNNAIISYDHERRDILEYMEEVGETAPDYDILEKAINSDVYYDRIIEIKEVDSSKDYVYDLTVEDTHNMCSIGGINLFDTFHSSGVGSKSNVTQGMPRMQEIINSGDTKTPSLTIYLNPLKDDMTNTEIEGWHKEIANRMINVTVSDLLVSDEIIYDPDTDKTTDGRDITLVKDYIKYTIDYQKPVLSTTKFVIRLEFDKRKLLVNQLRMNYIKNKILSLKPNAYHVISSDDNSENLVVRIHVIPSKLSSKNKSDEIAIVKKNRSEILGMSLKGVANLSAIETRKIKRDKINTETGKIETVDDHFIDTDGTNLEYVLGLPYINYTKTFSNSIKEIYQVLGIEAARNTIIKELKNVIEFAGSYVDDHHYELLADVMTFPGQLVAVTRHGIGKLKNETLGKASFEEMIDNIKNACIRGEKEGINGVSAGVMFSQIARTGTGAFDLLIDEVEYGLDDDELDDILG